MQRQQTRPPRPTGDNVISLFDQKHSAPEGVLNQLFTYWEQLRDGRMAPIRSEIDPRRIKGTLQHTFILERVTHGAPKFRLAGIEVCDLLGMELRGMPGHALFDDIDRARFNDILEGVLQSPHIAELRLQGKLAADHMVRAKMILLPLQGDKGELNRVLGAITLDRELMRPPVRFTIEHKTVTRIISGQKIPDFARAELAFNESSTPFNHHPKRAPTAGERPILKLVE
ncbi:hypothetical protein GCM10007939_23280 [Amylibacter marinus]|uniref:PAS domain-containing protein n=1 Tax=Amylibacter marinus TaxID=1475483 RepID=A0ABQ5VXU0_9RHOB|nr:PAS domain-containing protein [Amylibacter marinus]GLQ36044.1 hypothetical protein GCM10007939_23280 [Amylibacter marinus]